MTLLDRLQAATGPSRELDAEIALANGWTRGPSDGLPENYWRSPDGQVRNQPPPRFSESIDAALTVLPSWANSDFGPKGVDAYVSLNNVAIGHKLFDGWHRTSPALALLIAIMKAQDSKP